MDMKTFKFILSVIAIFAVCYYLTVYVNIILGAIAIGVGINIIDKLFIHGAE